MKLLRLKIGSSFRSLPRGFELYFLREFHYDDATKFNPYVLSGLNGSGKSNVLEALSSVFYHLDCIYLRHKPDYFDKSKDNLDGFDADRSEINSYEVEYFTFLDNEVFIDIDCSNFAHVLITKRPNKRPEIEWVNQTKFRISRELSQKESKALLPEYIIGYASGQNQILSLPFFKSRFLQYEEYVNFLKDDVPVEPKPESSLVYLDSDFSQAILLANLLMQPEEKGLLKPFTDFVKVEDVDRFRLIIKLNTHLPNSGVRNISSDDQGADKMLQLIGLLDKRVGNSDYDLSYIDKLKSCATCYQEIQYYDVPRDDNDEEEFFDDSHYLYLDYKVNEATKKAFQFHFENNPLKLFELLQLFIILDKYEISQKEKIRIFNSKNLFLVNDIHRRPKEADRTLRFKDLYLRKTGLTKSIFTKALSDGEHQFMHSIGLSLLFKDARTLFLLDEPETHFNPEWKAKFISSLRDSFKLEEEKSENTMREMLITTHSPYLISDSEPEYVLLFRKNKTSGKVMKPMRPDFNTLGTSVNKIGIRLYDMPNTIGEYAQSLVKKYEDKFDCYMSDKEKNALLKEIYENLGESVERVILINKILKSMDN
ncbi:MAG: restriction system-associated AAA family ATPase [Nonlabens sp.]